MRRFRVCKEAPGFLFALAPLLKIHKREAKRGLGGVIRPHAAGVALDDPDAVATCGAAPVPFSAQY